MWKNLKTFFFCRSGLLFYCLNQRLNVYVYKAAAEYTYGVKFLFGNLQYLPQKATHFED